MSLNLKLPAGSTGRGANTIESTTGSYSVPTHSCMRLVGGHAMPIHQTRRPFHDHCRFEGHALTRLLRWPEIEFAASTLEQSDSVVKHAYGTTLAGTHEAIADGTVPESRILWKFAPNPHAHDKPRECYSLTTHGVRNAYWIGFVGEEDRQDAKTDL